MDTPDLPRAKADYLRIGLGEVHGWLNMSTAMYMASLEVLQRREGVHGDVCEIGVHHGKSFLCLALGLPPDQRGVAIDVFGDQEANLDRSGRGDQAVFEQHLADYRIRDAVDVVPSSSVSLEEQGFVDQGRRFRLFSVDGGHTADVTRNDLDLAERTVVDGGLVLLDDVLNRHWLGVASGLFAYWSAGGSLVPAVLIPDRLVLSPTAEGADSCRALMRKHFAGALEKERVPLAAAEIDVYGQTSWVVVDEVGGRALVSGPEPRGPEREPTVVVPQQYLEDLEARGTELKARIVEIDARLAAQLEAPLIRELSRRYPGVARIARPVARPLRAQLRRLRRR